MPHRNIRILIIAVTAAYVCFVRADHNPYARHVVRAYNEIERHALYRLSGRKLMDGAVQGMVDKLNREGDLHSHYFSAQEATELFSKMHQSFGGVGIVISKRGEPEELTIIAQPEPGTPAASHDIRMGDVIVEIDKESTDKLSMNGARDRMRGQIGEPVNLTLRHLGEEQPARVVIHRELIKIETIKGFAKTQEPDNAEWIYRLLDDERIAYIRIESFADQTLRELREVLTNLKQEGVQGVVLDLRGNAGGELSTAVAVSDLFLDEGQGIVSIKDRFGRTKSQHSASGNGQFRELPLVVLIDRASASASEILAACLQDNDRAVLVGERSYGKGTVQQLIHTGPPVEIYGKKQTPTLKLTTANYWRPSGKNIHRMKHDSPRDDPAEWGVLPNDGFHVPLSDETYKDYYLDRLSRDAYNPNGIVLPPPGGESTTSFDDRVFQLAIEQLQKQLAGR